MTDFDVTIGQRFVSGRNPACAILIIHKALSAGQSEVRGQIHTAQALQAYSSQRSDTHSEVSAGIPQPEVRYTQCSLCRHTPARGQIHTVKSMQAYHFIRQ